jgi:hypothetical protein
MPCLDRAGGGECPYRAAYGCTDEDKADGISLGRCIIEAAKRQEILDEYEPWIEWLPEEERRGFAMAVVRLIEAILYSTRAQTWRDMVFNREVASGAVLFESREYNLAERYAYGGSLRFARSLGRLRPLVERAKTFKTANGPWRALVAARQMLDREKPGWDAPKKLEIA